jgi:hypothetical protein
VDFTPDIDDDEFTELVGADFPRVDLVSRPANGAKGFLVMKADASAGLLDAAVVRDLIAKTSPEEAPVPASAEAREAVLPNGIVIKGDPIAMAAFFNAANARPVPTPADVAKAALSAKAQNDLPDSAFAYVESGGTKDESGKTTPRSLRHFNVGDKAHADNAAARIAQGAEFGDEAKPKVEAAQRKFGEKKVSKEAGVPDAVTKADPMDTAGDAVMLDEGMDGLDPTVPLAAPDAELNLPGDPTDPGSPAWEGIDAASAQKWLSIAARLKNALSVLAERETLEAASADPSDIENAWNLEDAMCAVDFAIEQLAVFAAGEQAEAELGAEMAEMCKALAGFDPAPLGVIEGLTAVRKSGRVLSSANEARIRDAANALESVLASLPSAPPAAEPVTKEKEAAMPATATAEAPAQTVTKERTAEQQASDKGPGNTGGGDGSGEPTAAQPESAMPLQTPDPGGDIPDKKVMKAAVPAAPSKLAALKVAVRDMFGESFLVAPGAIRTSVAKADGDTDAKTPMQAVFDEDGDLIGIVDPADITPVSGTGGGKSGGADDAPAPAPAADDMQPQPPADAGVAADAVGKAAGEENVTTAQAVDLQSTITKAVAAALGALAPAEDVAKSADVAAALAEVELLKARLKTVEEMPAMPGVFTNGQVPPKDGSRPLPAPGQLRGQDAGAQSVDITKAAALKETLYNGSGPAQAQAFHELEGMAITKFAQIRSGQGSPAAPF